MSADHPVGIHAKDGMFLLRLHGGGWIDQNKDWRDPDPELVRPLLILDPEDDGCIERFAIALADSNISRKSWADRPEDARGRALDELRSVVHSLLAPKPDEPQGLGAVAADRFGDYWIRVNTEPGCWAQQGDVGDIRAWRHWERIDAVRVLSEGVTA